MGSRDGLEVVCELPKVVFKLFSVSIVMPLPACHINGIIYYIAFEAKLLSLNIFEIHPCCCIYR